MIKIVRILKLQYFLILNFKKINSRLILKSKMSSTTRTTTPIAAAAAGQVFKTANRVGRGVPIITDLYIKRCSCNRDKTIVFCRACGYYCHGRIRLKCQQHPRITFLLDITECPRCHSSVFLDEHFVPS